MKIAIVTAGGAGMFCGSCMHDNAWARGLIDAGHDVTLIPTYTPIRVDEANLSSRKIYLGGINIYMESNSRLWRKLPRFLTRWLDSPAIIKLASRFSLSNDAKHLGNLTIASLEGSDGPQSREIEELATFLCDDLRPDVICFSNILQIGAVSAIRKRFTGKLYCVLQGDDIFLNDLPVTFRTQAIDLISSKANDFDGFIVHSRFYGEAMAEMLRLPTGKFQRLPLGIDLTGHDGTPKDASTTPLTIGYFARVCPEKGFDLAIEAFTEFHKQYPDSRLIAGGYLGKRDHNFYKRVTDAAKALGNAFSYLGSPATHKAKVAFFKRCDLFTVPTRYHEPKGLPVLEAWANGIPVVQPGHGSFPEMIEATGGGLTVEPDNRDALVQGWAQLAEDGELRQKLARAGHSGVREHYSLEEMVKKTEMLFGL